MLEFFAGLFALIIAITIHEFSHAITADRLGDPTPRSDGRVSLNPLRHLDPMGTLMLLVFHFGWGKPVQFDPYNLSHPRRDSAIISLAGPISNLSLAILLSLINKFLTISPMFSILINYTIFLNISLAIFNLVPVYPLDGEKILAGILPRDLSYEFQSIMRRYGMIILVLLVLPVFGSSPINSLISPIISFFTNLLIPGTI